MFYYSKATPNKHELCKQMHEVFKTQNSYEKLVYSHDIARVVQCLLKYSQAEIKNDICDILLPYIPSMAMSKYAHFCVLRMLKYGTKATKGKLIKSFYGNVIKLTTHNISNELIDIAYNSYASDYERAQLRQEFYTDMYKSDKEVKVKMLSDTWKESPEMKKAILSRTKANLLKCVNKELLDNSLVHEVLFDYLNECTEIDKNEMIQALIPFVAQLESTKEGTQAAIMCFLHSVTKDRRAILKGIKEYVVKICNAEFGHLFMITILNCTDDTVILGRLILSVILSSVESIATNEWGRKVLEWIVAPEDRAFFHPKLISKTKEDLKFSKKDAIIRRKEILTIVENELTSKIIENPSFWLKNGSIGLLAVAILNIVRDDQKQKVYDALVSVICSPDWKVLEKDGIQVDKRDPEETQKQEAQSLVLGIEHPGLHVVIKKMIKNDKDKIDTEDLSLTKTIIDHLNESTLKIWITLNRACFILVTILEHASDESKNQLKSKLNIKLIEKQNHVGSTVLLKKIKD